MKNVIRMLMKTVAKDNCFGMEGPPTAPENWCCPKCGTLTSGDKCPKCGYAG